MIGVLPPIDHIAKGTPVVPAKERQWVKESLKKAPAFACVVL